MNDLRPVTRTTFSTLDYAKAVHEADPSLSRESAGVLWAQYAIETGRGKFCWNCNIGNVKVTRAMVNAGRPYFMLPNTWEMVNGKRLVFQPPDEQTWFRHFDTLGEAMTHHVRFLREERYRPAWPAVLSGDPDTFARTLKTLGYYTASADLYAAAMSSFHSEWMRIVDFDAIAGREPVEPSEPMGGIIHGNSVVEWALEQREVERREKLEAMLAEVIGSYGRIDFEAAA